MISRKRTLFGAFACLLSPSALFAETGCRKAPVASNETLSIAAASDLRRAAPELGEAFKKKTGISVTFTFAASGILARQLEQGAPYAAFLSASRDHAVAASTGASSTCEAHTLTRYARGALVLWAPPGKPLPKTLDELSEARYSRIAIANPEHAPYGRASKEALTRANVWANVSSKVVIADSVDQALSFARSGNADIVFASKALLVESDGPTMPVPSMLYAPLEQTAIQCARTHNAGTFMAFLTSPEAIAVLTRYGFALP